MSAATAAAVVTVGVATVVTAIVVVDEQQDHDDEQKPRAVRLAAEQITQTHKFSSSFPIDRRVKPAFTSYYAADHAW